jgi:uncharacterized protein YjbJ (UPF0337 family)
MDENRISGTAQNIGGRAEEGVGRVSGDIKTQIRVKLERARPLRSNRGRGA